MWAFVIIGGGLIGLFYGYTNKLETHQKSRIAFFIRFLGLSLAFLSFSQTESAILIVILLAVLLPVIGAILPLHLLQRGTPKRQLSQMLMARSPSKISLKEYMQEGVELTQTGMHELVELYESNPKLLNNLSGRAKRKTLLLLEEERRRRRNSQK